MSNKVEQFNAYRQKVNKRILEAANTPIKRFYSLDTLTYQLPTGCQNQRDAGISGLYGSLL